ncbi:hypothetical protein Hypma_009082 [Hypsizygus marmoreus]|uniref:F-box domain-containing protein n=1 Tax=Hypsizygus marmoreus TaxID=39966 RepID=A0A369JXE4_HYPMA|nr:hypothetical protein Hypma_009082 [Hypsizygus marmoreus]
MTSLPAEILLEIFKAACTDDGSTGRALATTSRLFHHLSKEFWFQSIAATGARQLKDLAVILTNTPPRFRRVRHLFLSNVLECSSDKKQCRMFHLKLREFWEYEAEASAAFIHLLQIVSPTLETLHIVSDIPRTSMLIPISLPRLVSMTMTGPTHIYINSNDNLPIFPALQHLSLVCFTEYPPELFEDISRQAPSLTHLFLSPERPSLHLAYDLTRAVNPAFLEAFEPLPCLSSVERIYIQPGPKPKPERNFWTQIAQQYMLAALYKLVEVDRRLVIVEGSQDNVSGREDAVWQQDSPVFA